VAIIFFIDFQSLKYKGQSNLIRGYKFEALNSKDVNLHITAELCTKTLTIYIRMVFRIEESRTQTVYT
jgi:hypothetical protein